MGDVGHKQVIPEMIVCCVFVHLSHQAIATIREKPHVIVAIPMEPVHVNENTAIGLFKENFIKIMIEQDPKQREQNLLRLQESIESYILPIRKTESKSRKHNGSNKYKNNQKSSF